MIKINEIIKNASQEHAKQVLGEDQFKGNPEAVESISADFASGADFAVTNILGMPNQYPLLGVITFQGDPQDKEAFKLTVKTAGFSEADLVDSLLKLIQARLQAHKTGMVVVTMPEAEALRRKAFEESLAVVRGGKSKPD